MAICVTGGSSGLGRAIAERFARGGTEVFLNYHANDAAAADAAAAVEAAGGAPHLVKADVGTLAGARELIGAVAARVDRLDQLVHAAARPVSGPLLELAPEELEKSVAVNGLALVNLVREALPLLGEGSTVFYLSSRGARRVIPDYGALGTAKALGEHAVRYLAREVGPRGIRVLTVAPGSVDTAAYRAMFPETWEERLAASAEANPMGRAVELEDCSRVVELLADPALTMVQGETITIDGGVSL
ncbi:MAG TPA: SDR family oxidoreductase [Solirubrobacterales bacterium]|jgi:NAD(P)-dependent dehydrogenase (short-subunit alcohol dehydrogenase family)|nr:SDR family oxidoreductase [Solirubrobacterales bacterium]